MIVTPEECAREVLDVIPTVMRSLRAEFRSHRGSNLSIPQYRALMFLRRTQGASLSAVADHLGITPPSTSKLIDGLVERGFVDRQASGVDRRKVTLQLTPAGLERAESSYQETLAAYVQCFSALPEETLATIAKAMETLRPIFGEDARRLQE